MFFEEECALGPTARAVGPPTARSSGLQSRNRHQRGCATLPGPLGQRNNSQLTGSPASQLTGSAERGWQAAGPAVRGANRARALPLARGRKEARGRADHTAPLRYGRTFKVRTLSFRLLEKLHLCTLTGTGPWCAQVLRGASRLPRPRPIPVTTT